MNKHEMNKVSKTLVAKFIPTFCMLTNSDFETIGLSCKKEKKNCLLIVKYITKIKNISADDLIGRNNFYLIECNR